MRHQRNILLVINFLVHTNWSNLIHTSSPFLSGNPVPSGSYNFSSGARECSIFFWGLFVLRVGSMKSCHHVNPLLVDRAKVIRKYTCASIIINAKALETNTCRSELASNSASQYIITIGNSSIIDSSINVNFLSFDSLHSEIKERFHPPLRYGYHFVKT